MLHIDGVPLCGQLNRKHGLLLPPAASRWASVTANGHKTPVQHNTTKRLPGPELNTHAQSHSKTRNSPNKQTCSYGGMRTRRVCTAPPSLIWLVICFNLLNRGWVFLTVWVGTEDEWKHDREPQKDWLWIRGLGVKKKRWKSGLFSEGEIKNSSTGKLQENLLILTKLNALHQFQLVDFIVDSSEM